MATILIAEDNRVNQRMLMFTLKKEGHMVLAALHGGEALEQLAKTPVDLLIADIEMPEMDGVTLLKHVRSDARYKALPVIVLTASAEGDDYDTARAAGANDVLTKPVSSQELIGLVEKRLAPHK